MKALEKTFIRLETQGDRLMRKSFAELLRWEIDNDPAPRKGDRTRHALVWATIDLLNRSSYHDIRLSDICELADVSSAAFYQYFENKVSISEHALFLFVDSIFSSLSNRPVIDDNREAIFQANLSWLKVARLNKGLMRGILQVGFEIKSVSVYFDKLNAEYCEAAAKALAVRSGHDLDRSRLLTAALSSMTDDFTRRILNEESQELAQIVARRLGNDEKLADFLTDIWNHTIYTA